MSFPYSVYGLSLRSNLPLPGLSPLPSGSPPQVEIRLGERPSRPSQSGRRARYRSAACEANGIPTLMVWEYSAQPAFHFIYGDGTEFYVDRRGENVWASWPGSLTLEDTTTYLLGPVLGFVLRLHGTTCLHASAIAVGNRAFALLGSPGAGKSTTAAAFAQRGQPVLCDDLIALEDRTNEFLAQPGYPRLCLWPDTAEPLGRSAADLPRLTPNWEKRYLDLNKTGRRFQLTALPLAAIYVLGPRSAEAIASRVASINAAAGLLELVANTYSSYLLDSTMRAREFELLGRMANRIPLRRLRPHTDPAQLGKLCEAILADFHALGGARAASAAARR